MNRLWLALLTVVAISSVSRADDAEDKAVEIVKRHGKVSRAKPDGPVTEVWLRDVTDDSLKAVAQFKNLTDLDLAPHWTSEKKSRIPNEGLQHLASLKKLTRLDLSRTTVTDAGLEHLAKLEKLQVLNLHQTEVTDAGLQGLAGLKELTHLHLHNTAVADDGLSWLTGIPNLKTLWLHATRVSDNGLKHLAKIKSLEWLTLDGTRVTAAGIRELTQLKNLSRLHMSSLTDAKLVELAKCKLLHTLGQAQTRAQAMGEEKPPANGEEVRHFDLSSEPEVTVKGLLVLASLKHLAKINIPQTMEIDDTLLLELSKVGLLPALLQHETGGVFPAKLAEQITQLDFSKTKITAKGIATLKPFRKLAYLALPKIDDATLEELRKIDLLHALPNATTDGLLRTDGTTGAEKADDVYYLDLRETSVTVNGLKALAPLKNLVSLTLPPDLDVDDKLLTELGKIRLLHALPQALAKDAARPEKPDAVITFNLRETKVTPAGWKELKAFKNLETLEFDEINDDVLASLQKLDMLHVLPNASAGEGKRAAKATEVTEVDLRNTLVTDKGVKALAPCKNLVKLSLAGERITDECLSSLAELKQLGKLELLGTRVTPEGVRKLRKALPKCEIEQ